MKKRLFALVLCVAVLGVAIGLAGCGDSSAYNLVKSATQKTSALDSYAAKMTMDIELVLSGEIVTIPAIEYDITAAGMQSNNPTMRMKTTSTSQSGENQIDMYVENGNYYVSMMSEKYQVPANRITADMRVDNTLDGIMAELPKNLFDGIDVEQKDDTKSIVIYPSKEVFNELYSELLEQTTSALGASDASVEISDTKIEIVVDKNGYIASETVSFVMKLTMTATGSTMEVTAKTDIKVEYINPGSDVTVTAPEGYAEYPVLE